MSLVLAPPTKRSLNFFDREAPCDSKSEANIARSKRMSLVLAPHTKRRLNFFVCEAQCRLPNWTQLGPVRQITPEQIVSLYAVFWHKTLLSATLSYRFAMVSLWVSYGFTMVLVRFCYGSAMDLLWAPEDPRCQRIPKKSQALKGFQLFPPRGRLQPRQKYQEFASIMKGFQ